MRGGRRCQKEAKCLQRRHVYSAVKNGWRHVEVFPKNTQTATTMTTITTTKQTSQQWKQREVRAHIGRKPQVCTYCTTKHTLHSVKERANTHTHTHTQWLCCVAVPTYNRNQLWSSICQPSTLCCLYVCVCWVLYDSLNECVYILFLSMRIIALSVCLLTVCVLAYLSVCTMGGK